MKWSVCKYGGGVVILPTDYVMSIMMADLSEYTEFVIERSFTNKELAIEYLTELVISNNLIEKALE